MKNILNNTKKVKMKNLGDNSESDDEDAIKFEPRFK